MKNRPLIDNYEQILDAAGYKYCVYYDTFYVYRILPVNMTCWDNEDWKYYEVTASWRKKLKYLPYNWGYQ